MEGRKLKDHVIQLYQSIKQVLSHRERQFLYKLLKDYKLDHDADDLALQLCKLCTSLDRVEIVRNVWTQIIHGHLSEFDQIMKDNPVGRSSHQILLKVDKLSAESQITSHTKKLFDEENSRGTIHMIKIYKRGDNNVGFCTRGGLEHGLGIYVSGIEEDSAAEESGLLVGDKVLEVNNISINKLPSSSAVKVMTGSNQLKLVVERTGRVPEWRLSRERTVWYDCQTKMLRHGDFEDFSTANYFRGIDVDIPERCVTLSNETDNEDLGFNITGGNEYRLGVYVSKVDEGSQAEKNGIQVGDQIIDVNGIPYDNISHAHATEILKDHTHLMLTLRDVGRYPVYKEIYAEYTWTGTSTSDGTESYKSNERLIERKLSDTWIESHMHKKKKDLHHRVPVQVISSHDNNDGIDSLHPEIYLPESDDISHVILQSSSSYSDSLAPIDTWIGESGHSNPTFQPDEMGDNSSSNIESMGDNSSSDDGSGIHGEYNVTMDDIIRETEEDYNKKAKLNIYQYIIHKNQDNIDAGSVKESGKKSVERYIFDDDSVSQADTSLLGDTNEDDIRSETLSRHSLVLDEDDKTQNYHSSPSFSTFSQHNKTISLTSLDDWKKSIVSSKEDKTVNLTDSAVRESNSDGADDFTVNIRNDEICINKEQNDDITSDNFTISVVPGSVYERNKVIRENRYRKKDDNKSKNSRLKTGTTDFTHRVTNKVNGSLEFGRVNLNQNVNESTDDLSDEGNHFHVENEHFDDSNSSRTIRVVDNNTELFQKSVDNTDRSMNDLDIISTSFSGQSKQFIDSDENDISNEIYISEPYETHSLDFMNSQTESVMNDFDRQIKNLENRKSELGMYEMTNFSSTEDQSHKGSSKKGRRGSLFKLSRRKSTDMASKTSSWKVLKKKLRSGLFRKQTHGQMERKADFVWSKYNPNTFDEEGMDLLERSAHELFEPDEVVAILRHVKTYHDDHDIDKLVDYLLSCIDIPDKILLLKYVRQAIYKFDMFCFDELVKQFEMEAYEKLSTKVHQQLNHEKRGKPRKHILQPETDDFGHFFIKSTNKPKEREQTIQSNEDDSVYIEKYGKDIVVTHISKEKQMLGLCVSGGIESKRQPQIKVDEVLEGGAAADVHRIQPGMIVVAIDDTDLREVTHADAILALKTSFSDKTNPSMTVVLTDSVVC